MVLYHKDFAKESFETADFWHVSGIYEEPREDWDIELVTDEKTVMLNRSRAKALLLADEMNAEITVEQDNDELRIVISKKIQ